MGFMVVLSSLWITTQSPLNTLKGSLPAWEVKEVVNDLPKAKTGAARTIEQKGKKVDPVEAANVKAAVDAALVTKVATPTAPLEPDQNKFARFDIVTDYLATNTYEVGGSDPEFVSFEFSHQPKYAVVQFCQVQQVETEFGRPPPTAKCDPTSDKNGYVVLEKNLGSLRLPPIVAFISSILLFGLGLLALHWRERDEAEAEERAAAAAAPAPVPAKV